MRRSGLRWLSLACGALVATAGAPLVAGALGRRRAGARSTPRASWRAGISNHRAFTHDSLDSLGYDWGRVAAPSITPRPPLKIVTPRTTAEVATLVAEARALGERLVVRSKGHSSNDLVLAERGALLLTQELNAIGPLDERAMVVTAGAGVAQGRLDEWLAERGYGLPVVGSHYDITVGGFASVGGIGPASHRHGLFVDTVESLECVTWEGTIIRCSLTADPTRFYQVLTGTGQHGVITALTLRVIQLDKHRAVLENRQTRFRDLGTFLEASAEFFSAPGDVLYARGMWGNLPLGARTLTVGQLSTYRATPQTPLKRLRAGLAYGYLHGIGFLAGRLPKKIGALLKYLGTISIFLSPRYAVSKHIEIDNDKTLDSTIGEPTRWLVTLPPVTHYAALFRRGYDLLLDYRERYGCFTFIFIYVKGIRSPYLAQGRADNRFCELMFYVGIDEVRLTPALLDEVVSRLDDLCIESGAFRYMHSKTVKDPARRARIDPNAHYARSVALAATPAPASYGAGGER